MLGDVNVSDYRVGLYTRGGRSQVGQFDSDTLTSVQWERKQDDSSAAQIEFGIGGNCELLALADPIATEIIIFRGASPVWVGPVTLVEFDRDSARLEALDLSAWLDWRVIGNNHSSKGNAYDLVYQAYELIEDAMSSDPVNVKVVFDRGDVVGERETLASDHRVAQDEVVELLRTDVDMIVTGRTFRLYGTDSEKVYLPDFTDNDFLDNVRIRRNGLKMATVVHINGGQSLWSVYPAEGERGSSRYGVKERVFNEPSILDQASLDQAAKTRWELLSKPVLEIEVPSGARLNPESNVGINDLVPGRRQRITIRDLCIPVSGTFRLSEVSVNANSSGEQVQVSYQPLGTVIE